MSSKKFLNVQLVAIFALMKFASFVQARENVDGMKKMSFKAPDLNEEQSHSRFLPDIFKCHACQAVAHQFYSTFEEFNGIHKQYKRKLPESEILDLVEKICSTATFDKYGVKEVNGVMRLTGPGIETDNTPGMIAGGGKWPGRLTSECSKLVEVLGEEAIYAAYMKNTDDDTMLKHILCHGKGETGACNEKNYGKRKTEL